MSYQASVALQEAVFQALTADPGLTALVGSDIFDAVPPGDVPALYVSLGPETADDRSDATGSGSLHRFVVTVTSDGAGFAGAKQVASAVESALAAGVTLSHGSLVFLYFERAVARRSGPAGRLRQIDLRFRARVDET